MEEVAGEDMIKEEAGLWALGMPFPMTSDKAGTRVVGSATLYVDALESSMEKSADVGPEDSIIGSLIADCEREGIKITTVKWAKKGGVGK